MSEFMPRYELLFRLWHKLENRMSTSLARASARWDSGLASVVSIVSSLLRLSRRQVLAVPAFLLPMIAAGRFAEGITIMEIAPGRFMVTPPLFAIPAFAPFAGLANFLVTIMIRAPILVAIAVVVAILTADMLGRIVLSLMVAIRCRNGHDAQTYPKCCQNVGNFHEVSPQSHVHSDCRNQATENERLTLTAVGIEAIFTSASYKVPQYQSS